MSNILDALALLNGDGGGELQFPVGRYQFDDQLAPALGGITLRGEGSHPSSGSILEYVGSETSLDLVSFAGLQHCGIKDMCIRSKTRLTGGYAVKFKNDGNNGSFKNFVNNLTIYYGYNGVGTDGSTETGVDNLMCRHLLGTRGFNHQGNSTVPSYGARLFGFTGDNPYPLPWGTRRTWTVSTGFTAGQIIFNNGCIFQCTTNGVSAISGTGPSGPPAVDADQVFVTEISDGSAKWKFVSGDMNWITQDSYGHSLNIMQARALEGRRGFLMLDTANTGSSYPLWCYSYNLECDHNLAQAALLNGGEGFFATTPQFISSLAENGLTIGSPFRRETVITGARIVGNWYHGVLLMPEPVDTTIDCAVIKDNSANGAGNSHGFISAGGASRFKVTNSRVTGSHGYGVVNLSGGGHDFVIEGNDLGGNVTGTISDGATGANRKIVNNIP